ncbi:hypothetical protein NL676_017558 [Syzygium grande]|nr:hypothetical protein NL676_017558 [Syzygium grande]
MRRSNDFKCLLLCLVVLPFCSSRDTLRNVSRIAYPGGEPLVSAGKRFELVFFCPNGSSNSRRYIGIWYYGLDPRIIVWVANRNVSLVGSTASFGLLHGDLQLWNGDGQPIWSTNVTGSSSSSRFAKLLDTGNLVLMEDDGTESIVWQSFNNPTNTFLPGMRMTDDFKLTSWVSQDDPTEGNFTFQRDQASVASEYKVMQNQHPYWKSGVYDNFIQADEMFDSIYSLLSMTALPRDRDSSNRRLVMNYDGHIQYFTPGNQSKPVWSQPRGRCGVFNACNKFQSCNERNGNETMCKCLPGFELRPGGCFRKSQLCEKNISTFLSLKMMKAENPDDQNRVDSEEHCKQKCLGDCKCQAYSFKEEGGTTTCYTWSDELDNMQEFAEDGLDLYVRVPLSDIESTNRSCGYCGTNLVPYPLSMGESCGDLLYSAFLCNNKTAQLYFERHKGGYRVTNINPENRTFTIQFNCTSSGPTEINQQLNLSSPFSVSSGCIGGQNDFSTGDSSGSVGLSEVKIEWSSPKEPLCNSSKDCDWAHATCENASDGTTSGLFYMRRQHGSTQGSRESTQENPDFRLYDSEKRIKMWMDSRQFEEDDKKGIDMRTNLEEVASGPFTRLLFQEDRKLQ